LEKDGVEFASGVAVEFDASGGQHLASALEGTSVDCVGQRRNGFHEGEQGTDVSEPAMGLLQVGLEKKPKITMGGMPLCDLIGQDSEPRWTLAHPARPGIAEHGLGHLGLAADDPTVEQAECHPKISPSHGENFACPADAVVE
jgi:hypothetical protein